VGALIEGCTAVMNGCSSRSMTSGRCLDSCTNQEAPHFTVQPFTVHKDQAAKMQQRPWSAHGSLVCTKCYDCSRDERTHNTSTETEDSQLRALCSAVSMKERALSDSQLGYGGLRYMMHS
jgi:hypothetical protein